MHINLMPNDYVAQRTVRRHLRAWAYVLAIAVICCAVLCGRNYVQVRALANQVTEHSIKHPGLRQMNAEIGRWEQELASAQAEKDAIEHLRNDQRALMLVGLVAQSVDQASGKVRLQHLSIRIPSARDAASLHTGNQPMTGSPAAPAENGKGSITLDGLAGDADTISRLVTILRQTGTLAEANLKGSSAISTGSEQYRQFTIECSF